MLNVFAGGATRLPDSDREEANVLVTAKAAAEVIIPFSKKLLLFIIGDMYN